MFLLLQLLQDSIVIIYQYNNSNSNYYIITVIIIITGLGGDIWQQLHPPLHAEDGAGLRLAAVPGCQRRGTPAAAVWHPDLPRG